MSQFDREKWNAKHAAGLAMPREPAAVLVGLDPYLPRHGRALDVAGGAGRHGIWLARRGLDVTIADVSPIGLALAREAAAGAGVRVATLETDLDLNPFPTGPWDLIVSVCYLLRPLFAVYPQFLAPGGILAVVQPTKRNLERHTKPPADFLLDEGELPRLVAGLEIVHYEEGWLADGRHDAVIVARKRGHHQLDSASRQLAFQSCASKTRMRDVLPCSSAQAPVEPRLHTHSPHPTNPGGG